LEGKFLSPYLKNKSIENFEVFVAQDEGMAFGKVKDIRKKINTI
jgi:hypothetical protein